MSSISIYKNKRSKENEKFEFKCRKRQIENIQGKISDISSDYASHHNEKINDFSDELGAAIKGITSVTNFINNLSSLKESEYGDLNLTSGSNYLGYEKKDCTTKIGELEEDIEELNTAYLQAVASELEEAKDAAVDGLNNGKKALENGCKSIYKNTIGKLV